MPRALIAETINLIVVLSGRGAARRVTELSTVRELAPNGDYVLLSSNLDPNPEGDRT